MVAHRQAGTSGHGQNRQTLFLMFIISILAIHPPSRPSGSAIFQPLQNPRWPNHVFTPGFPRLFPFLHFSAKDCAGIPVLHTGQMEKSSENLAAKAASGNAEAFRALIERHYDLMYRVAYRTLGQQADAEDLAQEVCAALPKKLASFRGDAKFESWLYRVVVNAGRDLMRRRGSRARAADGWGDVELMQRATATQKAENLGWLARAMQQLSPDLRETVALVLGEEMTHAQAGRVLGVKEGSVSWRMNEVKKQLRLMAKAEEMLR